MGSLLWTLSLDPATASWLICSPVISHHNDGLPPCPSLPGSVKNLFIPLIITLQDPAPHPPSLWSPSTTPSPLQCRSWAHTMQSSQTEGTLGGRDVVLVLFKCLQAPAFMSWISEPLKENTEALKPQKFISSWEVVGRTFWFVEEKIKVWRNAENPTCWLQKPV